MAISGTSIDDWANGTQSAGEAHSQPAGRTATIWSRCASKRPNLFVEELQERINVGATSPWGIERGAGFSRERSSQLMQIC
jgi:hypothetical protein